MRLAAAVLTSLAIAASALATPAAMRKPAPATAGVTLDGARVTVAQFRGKPLFINVWSSW